MSILYFNKKKNNDYYIHFNYQYIITIFMCRVYFWISCGLLLTSITSWIIANNNLIFNFIYNKNFLFFTFSLQFLIVFFLYNLLINFSEKLIITLFFLYSFLTGINFSTIFISYNILEIFISFFITSIIFIFIIFWSLITKKDLTNIVNLIFILILSILICSLFNYFLKSNFLIWFISYLNIIIFISLIAYDNQKLKILCKNLIDISNENNIEYNLLLNKFSILGALILYLDFINLFLIPLKIINKKNKK